MKTLLLMRHAKSSWKRKKLRDHDRPLSKRGKRDAPLMGEFLLTQCLVPDLILSSTAKRARKTAEKVGAACGLETPPTLADDLYPGDEDIFWQVIAGLDDKFERVMIVGHNPALEEFLALLLGRSELMPTGAIADVSLPIASWQHFTTDTLGTLLYRWCPKELIGKTATE